MKTRKQLFEFLTFALLIFTLAGSSVFAQQKEEESTATLEETLTFIEKKMEVNSDFYLYGSSQLNWVYKKRFKQINGCNVQMVWDVATTKKEIERIKNYTGATGIIESFSLSNIEPLTINMFDDTKADPGNHVFLAAPSYAIRFETTNSEKLIVSHYIDKSAPDAKSFFANLYFGSQEPAERVLKAFKHAVKLCGGKVEPF